MRILRPINGRCPRVEKSNHCVLSTCDPIFSGFEAMDPSMESISS